MQQTGPSCSQSVVPGETQRQLHWGIEVAAMSTESAKALLRRVADEELLLGMLQRREGFVRPEGPFLSAQAEGLGNRRHPRFGPVRAVALSSPHATLIPFDFA